jgi:CDP-glycerol glycerophosphotransferase (TagB/SpsB family)
MRVHFYTHHLYYLPQFLPVAKVMSERHEVSFGYSDRVTREEKEILNQAVTMSGWPIYGPSAAPTQARQADVLIMGASRFIESDYHRKRCLEYAPDVATQAVGFAKLDPLYGATSPGDLPLPSREGPKILYAPTFYPGSLEILGHLIPSWPRDWHIAIKPHQFTLTNPFYRYQRVLLQDLSRQYSNITLLPLEAYNILPAFQWADILVSEISSTIIEFTVLDRPTVVCDQVHLRMHHRWRGRRYLQRRLDTELLSKLDFAHHAAAADQVSNVIQYALEHPDELSDSRQAGRDLLVGPYDGQASQRIVKMIEEAVA